MILANALRGTGVIIAVLGLLDPAITLPWNEKPRVAIRLADAANGASDAQGAGRAEVGQDARALPDARAASDDAALRTLTQRVRERFAREFTVVDATDRATPVDATILIGGASARLPIDLDVDLGSAPGAAPGAGIGAADRAADKAAASTSATGTLVGVMPTAASTSASAGAVRITNIIAPRSSHLSSRVRLIVSLDARGLRGRTSIVEVQSEGLTLARATHVWTEDADHARLALEVTPIREGLAQFNVIVTAGAAAAAAGAPGAVDSAGPTGAAGAARTAGAATDGAPGTTGAAGAPSAAATPVGSTAAGSTAAGMTAPDASSAAQPLARADVGVRITDQPLRILFVEPRPSWTTRFIRLALAGDVRFRIDAQSQVSRGLAARTADAPTRLTAEALAPFDAVVIGAPDQLGAPDVEALRAFARLRGGLIVFAPDRLPQGAYIDLIPADGFEERLLETPQLVSSALADSRSDGNNASDGAAATAGRRGDTAETGTAAGSRSGSSGEGTTDVLDAELASLPLLASELALPRALRPGAVTLASVALQAGAARPIVIASPLGDGQVLFAGAMDAWRFRDRPQPRFDAFWRQVLFALGTQAPPPVTLTLDPQVARPGEAVTVRARWRRDLIAAQSLNDGSMTVRAALEPASSTASTASTATPSALGLSPSGARASTAQSSPVRLWPADRPGEFRGALNAPAGAGVYAMSLNAASPAPPLRALLLVSSDVRRPDRSWEAFRARIEARGGLTVTDDRLDQAVEHVRRQTRGPSDRTPVHPWRSAWWILPFAGCLGGEWLLRRRRGDA